MGLTVEVLGWLVAVAEAMRLSGRQEEAAELLASVIAEPESGKQTISDTISVAEKAQQVVEAIRPKLEEAILEQALARGAAVPYEAAAKTLIDSIR